MKYRIKQIGYYYYPQYKGFMFWHNLATYKRAFGSHAEALSSIELRKESMKAKKNKQIIHEL